MKKNITKVSIVLFLILFVLFLSNNSKNNISNSVKSQESIPKEISKDIENYYKNTKKNDHELKVSITKEMLRESRNTIFGLNSVENAVSGYNDAKKSIDALFKLGTKKKSNLSVTIKDKNDKPQVTYYNYELSEEPEEVNYNTSFLTPARNVKTRIENLILVYNATKDAKYLAALKKELVAAANWKNLWQSSQYIDTAEMGYAVSLGYDYAYEALSPSQRCVIENRLLEALLLYGTKNSSKALGKNGNFKQVGNSGAGLIALTLIESSGDAKIKVLETDNKSITIEYPVKSIKNKSVIYDYKKTLWNVLNKKKVIKQPAKITDETIYNLLINEIETKNGKKYIPLRDLYAAVITKTTKTLPGVLKSNYMYIEGTYPEGRNYQMLGMKYTSYYIATLKNTLKKDYGILNFENNSKKSNDVLNNIVLNPVYTTSADYDNFDFGDAIKNTNNSKIEDDLFYLANLNAANGHIDTANIIYDYKKKSDNNWGFYTIMWYDKEYDPKDIEVNYDEVFDKYIYNKNSIVSKNVGRIGVVSFKNSYTDKNGVFVAMKGGYTKDNHTQLDLGTYIYENLGVRWITDSGSAYDGTKYHDKEFLRWQYYVTRAEAHSTILIGNQKGNRKIFTNDETGGKGNCLDADQWIEAKATFNLFTSSDDTAMARLDLSDAYNRKFNQPIYDSKAKTKTEKPTIKPAKNNNKVKRGLKIFNNKQIVLVQDKLELEKDSEFYSILNVSKNVDVSIDDKRKVVTLTDKKDETKKVKIVLKSNNQDVRFGNIREVSEEGQGYMNKFIKYPKSNTRVKLELNDGVDEKRKNAQNSLNMNKIVVYSSKKITNVQVGVFYMSEEVYNNTNIDDLKLEDLDSWTAYDDDSMGESLYTYSN